MKKFLSVMLSLALVLAFLPGCSTQTASGGDAGDGAEHSDSSLMTPGADIANTPSFAGVSDPSLAQYIQDAVLADIESNFSDESIVVEDIQAVYLSQEYLDDLAFNSKSNLYFGYTLAELDEYFGEERYVFTLGESGETVVTAFEAYEDVVGDVVRNVAVGTGVILVCVAVSMATGGTGAPAAVQGAHALFAVAAKGATGLALSSGGISAAMAGVSTALQTGEVEDALKAAVLEGSEAYKLGAIIGASTSLVGKSFQMIGTSHKVPSFLKSEQDAAKRYNASSSQTSFLNGEVVANGREGSTRPDFMFNKNGAWFAGEVKNYDLMTSGSTLKKTLVEQLKARKNNLPSGVSQLVVLDVRGRGYSQSFVSDYVDGVREILQREIGETVAVEAMWA